MEKEINELLSGYSPSFKEGFSGRIMDRLNKEQGRIIRPDFNRGLDLVFRKMAAVAAAAVAVLMLSVYLSGGSLGVNSVLGESYSDDELISYLLYSDDAYAVSYTSEEE